MTFGLMIHHHIHMIPAIGEGVLIGIAVCWVRWRSPWRKR